MGNFLILKYCFLWMGEQSKNKCGRDRDAFYHVSKGFSIFILGMVTYINICQLFTTMYNMQTVILTDLQTNWANQTYIGGIFSAERNQRRSKWVRMLHLLFKNDHLLQLVSEHSCYLNNLLLLSNIIYVFRNNVIHLFVRQSVSIFRQFYCTTNYNCPTKHLSGISLLNYL